MEIRAGLRSLKYDDPHGDRLDAILEVLLDIRAELRWRFRDDPLWKAAERGDG